MVTSCHYPVSPTSWRSRGKQLFSSWSRGNQQSHYRGHSRTESGWWGSWGNHLVQGSTLKSKFPGCWWHTVVFKATFWQSWVSSGGTLIETLRFMSPNQCTSVYKSVDSQFCRAMIASVIGYWTCFLCQIAHASKMFADQHYKAWHTPKCLIYIP